MAFARATDDTSPEAALRRMALSMRSDTGGQRGGKPYTAEGFLAHLWAQDDALVAKGWKPITPWWRKEIERFFRSGARRWVARVGRRGIKSATVCRIAVAIATAQHWVLQPGEVGVVPLVSVSRDEASDRLTTIEAILNALGHKHDATADTIAMRTLPIEFRVRASSSKAGVGFTSVCMILDEVALWEASDDSADPARDVFASLNPTTATQPHAWTFLISAPWGTEDLHAEMYDRGDGDGQMVSYAPTWVANPTITEQQTHELEPDERLWERAFKALPGATISFALAPDEVSRAFADAPMPKVRGNRFVVIDASSLRADSFSWISGGEAHDGDKFMLAIDRVESLTYNTVKTMQMKEVVGLVADHAKDIGVTEVYGDQREEASLRSLFADVGITFISFAWSESSKMEAFTVLRRWLREQFIRGPHGATRLRKEMKAVQAIQTKRGTTQYPTNGKDELSALVTLAHAVIERRYFPPDNVVASAAAPELTPWQSEKQRFVPSGRANRVRGY